MSIFGNIMNKIFHHGQSNAAPASAPASEPAKPHAEFQESKPQQPASTPAAPQQSVDVEAVLTKMASAKGGGGNWRTSIVDLLKLLDLDSSLDARKKLANELDVHAGDDGSAEENMALHKAVMNKLAQNGGKVPDDMK